MIRCSIANHVVSRVVFQVEKIQRVGRAACSSARTGLVSPNNAGCMAEALGEGQSRTDCVEVRVRRWLRASS